MKKVIFLIALVAAVLVVSSCSNTIGPGISESDYVESGFDLEGVASRSMEADEAHTVTVFGAIFERGKGKPQTETVEFSVLSMVHGPFTLEVLNGNTDASDRVSSATIWLNDTQVARPSDFNQKVSSFQREVQLPTENVIEVELRGAPGSFIAITVTGLVDPDTEIEQVTDTIGTQGGVLNLPGVADLRIFANTVSENAEFRFMAVQSPMTDYVTSEVLSSFTPLDLPKLRIESSEYLGSPVYLQMHIPHIETVLPPGHELVFAIPIDIYIDNDEFEDVAVSPVEVLADQEMVLAMLDPTWFKRGSATATVSIGYVPRTTRTYRIFEVDQITPKETSKSVPFNESVILSAKIRLEKNFEFSDFLLEEMKLPVEGPFYRRTDGKYYYKGQLHNAIDIVSTKEKTEPWGVYSALPWVAGIVHEVDRNGNTEAGLYVKLRYDNMIISYSHLEKGSIPSWVEPDQPIIFAGSSIGLAGKTGKNGEPDYGKHLHFKVRLNGNVIIDPEPLVMNNMGKLLSAEIAPLEFWLTFTEQPPIGPPDLVVQPQRVDKISSTFEYELEIAKYMKLYEKRTFFLYLSSARIGGAHILAKWTIDAINPIPPKIDEISPSIGKADDLVTIYGDHFGKAQGSSFVTFNGDPSPVRVTDYGSWTDTSITLQVPESAVTGDVHVITDAGSSNGLPFEVSQDLNWTIVQITPETEEFDHRWPAINNEGDIVWSQEDNAGKWQVMKRDVETKNVSLISPSGSQYDNFQYPSFADNGNVICAAYNPSYEWWDLMMYPGGQRIEFSSRNSYNGAHRDAGKYTGMSSDGIAIWYYDWYSYGGAYPVRRLNITGNSRIHEYFSGNYVDINTAGDIVYSDNTGQIFKTKAGNPYSASWIGIGANPRINNNGVIIYISDATVQIIYGEFYSEKATIYSGVWADINDSKIIVFEDFDENGNRQIYKATPIVTY